MTEPTLDRMSRREFIALIAMMFSIVAFSIDAILPAMTSIGEDLAAQGRTHLLITGFMAGLAVGTLFAGPISDAVGRHRAMAFGVTLYIAGGLLAWLSQSFEIVLLGRVIQGLGASGPRIVSTAIVRDLYSGRQMARIVSLSRRASVIRTRRVWNRYASASLSARMSPARKARNTCA